MSRLILSIALIVTFIGCGGRAAVETSIDRDFTPGLRTITTEEKHAFSRVLLNYKQEKVNSGTKYANERVGVHLRKFYSYNPAAAKLYIDNNIARYDARYSYGRIDENVLAKYSNIAFITLLKDKQFGYLDKLWDMLNSDIASLRPNLKLALSADNWIVHNNNKHTYSSASRLSRYYGNGCVKTTKIDNTHRLNTTWGNCKPNRQKENYYFRKMLEHENNLIQNITFALSKAEHYYKYKNNEISLWWYVVAADMTNHIVKNKKGKYILKVKKLPTYLTMTRIKTLSNDISLYVKSIPSPGISKNTSLINNLQMLVEAGYSRLSGVYSQKQSR
ncbi:hypothetical protein [Aliikangiella sp. IMCC44359]|uniref:hypothetical protein n=1 Tax=Aliikangiella sp. IMCC44359 TaxID=3459125 RepID=UPI00403B1A72